MYQALYRSFRPETFETLLGQEHIERILKNQLASGTTGHAYIFCGTRGTGKTTTARLLAKALNCTGEKEGNVEKPCGKCANCRSIAEGSFVDVMEIDAASNRGVDDIRELRDTVNFPPIQGRYKVYIIDEAHMLTKLPATILSRCLRLDFRRVSEEVLMKRFAEICREIGSEIDSDALALIAANADGSVRDGLSLLDRCVSAGGHITRADVLQLLGMAGSETYIEITDKVLSGQTGEALAVLAKVLAEGKEVNQFGKDWVEHFRNLMIIKYTKQPEAVLNLSLENIERLRVQAEGVSMERIRQCVLQLSKALADAKWSPRPRILFELAIITMSEGEVEEAVPVRRTVPAVGQTAAAKPAEAPKPVVQTPAPAPKPAAPAPVQKAPEPEEDPFFAMNSSEAPPSEFFDIAPPADYVDEPVSMPPQEAPRPSKPAAEPISATENDELWLRVL
ncbi:MAG: DNA polymerase III subunit gamma/tau, partial [Clostridia bacterium]|nr:DNA polymerase III subunit gamma/tau [Clostridia bacterium]